VVASTIDLGWLRKHPTGSAIALPVTDCSFLHEATLAIQCLRPSTFGTAARQPPRATGRKPFPFAKDGCLTAAILHPRGDDLDGPSCTIAIGR
jgi:hypothetical protein